MTGNFRFRAPVAGLVNLVIGVGLGRYAYTALMPALILGGQLTSSEAAYAGAANLAGYVIGALIAPRLAGGNHPVRLVRLGIVFTVVGLAASALPLGFWWLSAWRLIIGVCAGVMMTSGTSLVLTATPRERLAAATGIVFSGVGIGTALSGFSVPHLVEYGPAMAWIGLAVMALVLAPLAWFGWPESPEPAGDSHANHPSAEKTTLPAAARLHVAAYFLYGIGLMPHSIFWVDYIARGLERGMALGGSLWGFVGLGAVLGAPLGGLIATRWGFRIGLLGSLPLFAAGIALPVLTTHIAVLWLSSFLFGIMMPAVPALISGRTSQIVHQRDFTRFWGTMTVAVSIGQGAGAYLLAMIYDLSQSFVIVFLVGAAAALSATFLCLSSVVTPTPAAPRRGPDASSGEAGRDKSRTEPA